VVTDDPPAGEAAVFATDSLAATVAVARAAQDRGELEAAVAAWRRAQGVLGLELLYGGDDHFRYEESAEIQRGLAEAYLALDVPYAAAVEAARGANMVEADAGLWTLLGIARYRLADMDGAAEALERALTLDSGQVEAEWGLALVAASGNHLDEATRRGARVLSLWPEPRFALGLAQWSAAAGDYAAKRFKGHCDALEELLNAIESGGDPTGLLTEHAGADDCFPEIGTTLRRVIVAD